MLIARSPEAHAVSLRSTTASFLGPLSESHPARQKQAC